MNDFEIPTSPMVARVMLRFYKRMQELEGEGRWEKYIEFYEALTKALAQEELLREILEESDDLDN